MSRQELPEGVSPTNDKSSFAAPETVTPAFAPKMRRAHKQNPIEAQQDFVEQVFDENNDRGNDGGANREAKSPPNAMMIMIILAGLLTALAAIIITNTRSPMPLCSEQPEWNQHNCRRG